MPLPTPHIHQVAIVDNEALIIEQKLAVETVPVGQQARQSDHGQRGGPRPARRLGRGALRQGGGRRSRLFRLMATFARQSGSPVFCIVLGPRRQSEARGESSHRAGSSNGRNHIELARARTATRKRRRLEWTEPMSAELDNSDVFIVIPAYNEGRRSAMSCAMSALDIRTSSLWMTDRRMRRTSAPGRRRRSCCGTP